ncbi:hypothetical protein HDU96_006808 [Phlyctochytrium bullatum]|nr:hypothetical protein HDU96_006808 [Phlyctochytrium bullatum]
MDNLQKPRLDQLPIANLIANRKLSSLDRDIACVNASISRTADLISADVRLAAPFLALSVPLEQIEEARAVVSSLETALAEAVDEAEKERLEEERERETAVLEALCDDEEFYRAFEVNHIKSMAALGAKMDKLLDKQAKLLQQKTALDAEKENIAKEQARRRKSRKEELRTTTARIETVDRVVKMCDESIARHVEFIKGREDCCAEHSERLVDLAQRVEEEKAVLRSREEAVKEAVDAAEKEKLEESVKEQTRLLEVLSRLQRFCQEDEENQRKWQGKWWKFLDSDFRTKVKLLKEKAALLARKEELSKEGQGKNAFSRKKKNKQSPSLRRQVLLNSLKVDN